MMEKAWLLIFVLTGKATALWNNLNCPAPRSPENGLSFIFRNGELVHFRCHPGYVMHGKTVAYCVNNQWTAPAPECRTVRKVRRQNRAFDDGYLWTDEDRTYYTYHARPQQNMSILDARKEMNSKLFNWNKSEKRKGVYGDGPRRVPIINGIWPEHPEDIMSIGPKSTPGPIQLVKEEVNIAELRQKQYEEVAHHRESNPNLDLLPARKHKGKMRKKNKRKKLSPNESRKTLISLGKTEDGDALSIAFAKPTNETNEVIDPVGGHRYRHQESGKRKKIKSKGKKWKNQYDYPSNIIARTSRVDTSGYSPHQATRYSRNYHKNEVAELRRRPILNVRGENHLSQFDTSCVESFYGRDLPMIAPQVANAFVYRYETKKNKEFPFNSYMQVKYRCLSDYSFADGKAQILNCHEAKWVGDLPVCTRN